MAEGSETVQQWVMGQMRLLSVVDLSLPHGDARGKDKLTTPRFHLGLISQQPSAVQGGQGFMWRGSIHGSGANTPASWGLGRMGIFIVIGLILL
jgi:hypothetical protein